MGTKLRWSRGSIYRASRFSSPISFSRSKKNYDDQSYDEKALLEHWQINFKGIIIERGNRGSEIDKTKKRGKERRRR